MEEINSSGGLLGRKLDLVELDNQSSPIGSKMMAEKAVKERVAAVIGSNWSSQSIAAARVLQDAGIPMITPISTSPEVTEIGNCIFRVCYTDTFQGGIMAKFARKDLKAKTAVVLVNQNELYSVTLAKAFSESFSSLSGKVVWNGKYLEEDTDFTPLVLAMNKYKPDVIFIPGNVRNTGFIIKQAGKSGVKGYFLGGDSWDEGLYPYGEHFVEGNYYVNHWHESSNNPESRKFVNKYRKKFKDNINPGAALGYDAVMLLAEAIKKGGYNDSDNLRKAISSIRHLKGVTGTISLGNDRNPLNKSGVIMKCGKSGPLYYKTANY